MTDAETFAAICADFPFDVDALAGIHGRLNALLHKSLHGTLDRTISTVDLMRLRILTHAMRDLVAAMEMVQNDGDPEDFIPF